MLSWNEVKSRAYSFSNEWKDESSEHAEAKSFWDAFFHVFGLTRRRVASFEHSVKKLNDKQGFIDLFWPGKLIIEHKSRGRDLDKAFGQATDYFHGLKENELPRFVLVSDFARFRLYDLDEDEQHEFTLEELPNRIDLFGFILGYEKRSYKEQDPVNIAAAELMGRLHDRLYDIGYEGHQLEVYLVRLLFCLFAEDTGIFTPAGAFQEFLEYQTREDGSDLASRLGEIFQVLNTPEDKRLKNLDEALAALPYVNGKLFEEQLPLASFDSSMRQTLLDCCALDWGKISPAIFGSMFQSVMDPEERRNLGAHYTSEKNILKLIKPLFLDELWEEFEKLKRKPKQLPAFQEKLASLRFLDPACGCGNFLVITYRELRLLELEVLKILQKGQFVVDLDILLKVSVDQFYGIEYEEFPAQITQVAMWLMDHQMNQRISQEFGTYFVRLPLNKSATIVHGNALRLDWETLVSKEDLNFIIGNPPFIGAKWMTLEQRADMKAICFEVPKYGLLDYVTGWHIKIAQLLEEQDKIYAALVSTNSITQGEQVYPLWSYLLDQKIEINFAYRTFVWSNEARGKAAVHCVIIGFSKQKRDNPKIFIEEDSVIIETKANNINPYLIDASNLLIPNRSNPISDVPKIATGNKPIDGGNYIFSGQEKNELLAIEPNASKYLFPFIGAAEFIKGKTRYILNLKGISPKELRGLPEIFRRVELVREFRRKSKSKPTQKIAATPTLYHTENIPDSPFLVIPQVSSMRRKYIPIGFISPPVICSDKLRILPNATNYLFGVLTSEMHMAWMRTVTGRLKSDFQYSVLVVYNNFPWPDNPSKTNVEKVEAAAQAVLDARALYPDSSLADLYDPLSMPPELVKAHQKLDKAVDRCYRPQAFTTEANRIAYLFELYERYTAPLLAVEKKGKKRR